MSISQTSQSVVGYEHSASLEFTADDILNPKSEAFGLDLTVSFFNNFLTLMGCFDIFQDLTLFIGLMVFDAKAWLMLIPLAMLITDSLSIYVTSFNIPLGIRSIFVEKFVLTTIHVFDVMFDIGATIMFIFAGVWFGEDTFLVAVFAVALPVITLNYLQLYYTAFQYEKDHSDKYDVGREYLNDITDTEGYI